MFEKPSVADLRRAAERLGMNPSASYLAAVQDIIAPLANAYAALDAVQDELPPLSIGAAAARDRARRTTRWAPGT
jgi:hypothetical protein